MKCDQCQALTEGFVDGELDGSIAEQVGAHVGACIACANFVAGVKQEQEIYARYERDVEVTPALWAGVQARIKEERGEGARGLRERVRDWWETGFSAPRLSPALAAALIVATVGITIGVMSYWQSRNQTEVPVANRNATPSDDVSQTAPDKHAKDDAVVRNNDGSEPVEPLPVDSSPKSPIIRRKAPAETDPERLVREAEQKYLAAINILSRDLKDRRRQLNPETRSRFEIALAQIDQTIYATRLAVRKSPSDPIAIGYMLTAYSKKVDFLRDTARDETEGNRPF